MLSLNTSFFKPRSRTEYLYDNYNPRRSLASIWLKRTVKTLLLITLGVIPSLFIILSSKPACAANATADNTDYYVSMNNISEGSLLLKDENASQYRQIPLLDTQVNMNISGMLVRSHVKQYFKNTSNDWVEAVYVFPLPETAAVDHMRMQIGERIIEAQIKEKQQARKIYQVQKEVTEVALNHHLVSKYTSLVAVDISPSRPAEAEIKKQVLTNNTPQQKTYGKLAQTATSAGLQLIIGCTLLLFALISQILFSRKLKFKILSQ